MDNKEIALQITLKALEIEGVVQVDKKNIVSTSKGTFREDLKKHYTANAEMIVEFYEAVLKRLNGTECE